MVGQSAMSAAIGAPVTVMKNAGEGGAWGIAVLALFTCLGEKDLETFLEKIFENAEKSTLSANEAEISSFSAFMTKYKKALSVERLASEAL
jgi:sugar (pentulose or hexulose) kinase